MRILVTLILTLCMLATDHAHAKVDGRGGHSLGGFAVPEETSARAQQSKVSLDEAVSIARSRYGGKVISAQTRRKKGRAIHLVKLLSDSGQVRTVKVDGDSGRIL